MWKLSSLQPATILFKHKGKIQVALKIYRPVNNERKHSGEVALAASQELEKMMKGTECLA